MRFKYWYNPDSTVVYTNKAVFSNLHATGSIGSVLKKDESFCVANFPMMPFNKNNLMQIYLKLWEWTTFLPFELQHLAARLFPAAYIT